MARSRLTSGMVPGMLLLATGIFFLLAWSPEHGGFRFGSADMFYRAAALKRSFTAGSVQREALATLRPNYKMRVIAHRGAMRIAPENTLAAIQAAVERNADYIEIDVRETADNIAVLMHDATVDRTTNGSGQIAELTLAELRQLDAGSWFGAEYAGERVPTVQEVLQLVAGRACIVWDLKAAPSAVTVELFRAHEQTTGCLLVLSGKELPVQRLRRASLIWQWPEAPLMPLLKRAGEVDNLLQAHPYVRAFWIARGLDHTRIDEAHAAGVPVFTTADFDWDSVDGYRRLSDAGYDAIMIEDLDAFAAFVAAAIKHPGRPGSADYQAMGPGSAP